jgi:hypothetical protein
VSTLVEPISDPDMTAEDLLVADEAGLGGARTLPPHGKFCPVELAAGKLVRPTRQAQPTPACWYNMFSPNSLTAHDVAALTIALGGW